MSKELAGKKAVIAGGGRGIGLAIARRFLRAGAEALLAARTVSDLESARRELSPLGRVEIMSTDVSLEADADRLAGRVLDLWGGVDILVNAAAVSGPIGPLTEVDPGEWRKAVDINLVGTFLMIRAVAPLMKQGRRGKIINFVGGGEGAYVNFTAYVASKGGIVRLTETVAAELKDFGIDVNAIAPGAVNTRFLEDLLKAGRDKAGTVNYQKALMQQKDGGVSPEKAAALALFLASDESNGLSGKIISAVWDNYTDFPKRLKEIMESDVYTWRRVKPRDRGYEW